MWTAIKTLAELRNWNGGSVFADLHTAVSERARTCAHRTLEQYYSRAHGLGFRTECLLLYLTKWFGQQEYPKLVAEYVGRSQSERRSVRRRRPDFRKHRLSNRPFPILGQYTGLPVSPDPLQRNDAFWIPEALRDKTGLYFGRRDIPLTAEVQKALDGVGTIAFGQDKTRTDTDIWTWRHVRKPLRDTLNLITRLSIDPAGQRALIEYAWHYRYWTDLFRQYGTRVHVLHTSGSFSPYSVPAYEALRDRNGRTLVYQTSLLQPVPVVWYGTAADTVCCFDAASERTFQSAGSYVADYVHTGYPQTRKLGRLERTQPPYTVAFFDENSSDRLDSVISNTDAQRVYAWLLEQDFRLILKPKYPATLPARLGPALWSRIQQARANGHCRVVDSGAYVALTRPSALRADLCIGLLAGGTSCVETALAGTPSVFLDLENLRYHPWYERGDILVADTLERLGNVIRWHRNGELNIRTDWADVYRSVQSVEQALERLYVGVQ